MYGEYFIIYLIDVINISKSILRLLKNYITYILILLLLIISIFYYIKIKVK